MRGANRQRRGGRKPSNRPYLYGLSDEDFALMVQKQGGTCLLCLRPFGADLPPCIDHCHATGKVRGILCRGCNTGLGSFREDHAALARAAAYIQSGFSSLTDPNRR